MPAISACPDLARFQQLTTGQLSAEEKETLLLHLESCDTCAERMATLPDHDPLVEVLRQAGSRGVGPSGEKIARLIKKWSAQGPAAVGQQEQAQTPTVATVWPGTEAHGQADPGVHTEGSTQELYDFLAPAQAPGDLGRLGPYRVLALLGAGGMGVVFRAEDPQLKRLVALKAMRPTLAASASAKQRFLREAQTAAAIKHDHIVTIHQVGEDRGAPFLAMEFLEGESLEDRLHREKKLPLAEVLRIGGEIAAGLQAAHERGLIHRDIKPGNIWLEDRGHKRPACGPGGEPASGPLAATSGRVKILDFGLARATDSDANLTQEGAIVGTPAYMAPEQALGQKVDHRCDLFSLGCVLYRMATGRAPFTGSNTVSTLMAVSTENPRPPHEIDATVPRELSDLILRLLAKKPADRPASATEVVEALAGQRSRIRQNAGGSERADVPKATLRRRKLWAASLVALLALAALGWFLAPTVVRIVTNTGELVIETDDPNLEVTIKDGRVAVYDKVKDRRFVLKAGEYDVSVREEGDGGVRFATKRFSITRAGKETFHARLELAKAVKPGEAKVEAAGVVIPPEPLELKPGEALSPYVLVGKPAPIKGLRSWTLETRAPRSQFAIASLNSDAKLLALACIDGSIRIEEFPSGRLRRVLPGHSASVVLLWTCFAPMAWSPDGKILAAGGKDRLIRLWDVPSGRLLRTLRGHTTPVLCVAWSPDGKWLTSSEQKPDSPVRFWDVRSGAEIRVLQFLPGETVCQLSWSPKGDRLAGVGAVSGAGNSNTVRLWNAGSGEVAGAIAVPKEHILRFAWSPDGKLLATVGSTLRIWDCVSAKWTRVSKEATNDVSGTRAVAWSPDGQWVAASSDRSPLWVENTKSGKVRWRANTFVGPAIHALQWTPDSKNLVSSQIHLAQVWDARVGLSTREIRPNTSLITAAWSPDGKSLAVGTRSEQAPVRLWQPDSGKSLKTLPGPRVQITYLDWSSDGNRLAAVVGENSYLWGLQPDKLLWSLPQLHSYVGQPMAISHDNKRVAICGPKGKVRILDSTAGKLLQTLEGPAGSAPYTVAWSPDDKQIASFVKCQESACIWDSTSGKLLRSLKTPGATNVCWSPTGEEIITFGLGEDFPDTVLNADTGNVVRTLEAKSHGWVVAHAWSPDGKKLIAALGESGGGGVPIWDFATGKLERTLIGHAWDLTSASWSADGRTIMTAGWDGQVRFWDAATGRTLGVFLQLKGGKHLAISQEGHYRGSPGIEDELVYVAVTDDGTEMLTPAEFARK
jgi:WD40 repeat protein/serine/threonine protein kinase